jgi:hypothetical protein
VSFLGAVVTVGRRGPDGGDGVRGGRERGGVVPMANEERDGAVPGHGGEGRAAWTQRRCGGGRGGGSVDSVASKRAREILAA